MWFEVPLIVTDTLKCLYSFVDLFIVAINTLHIPILCVYDHSSIWLSIFCLTVHPYGCLYYDDLMKYNEKHNIWAMIYHIIESTNRCHNSVPPLWLFSVVAVSVFWDSFWLHRGNEQSCCVLSTSLGSFHWERCVLKSTLVNQNFQMSCLCKTYK